jgi:hypothetical protein
MLPFGHLDEKSRAFDHLISQHGHLVTFNGRLLGGEPQ